MPAYEVFAQRLPHRGSVATAKCAQVLLDTEFEGRQDAFNSVELLLAALAGGLLEGVAEARARLGLTIAGIAVRVGGTFQDAPRKLQRAEYTLWVESDASDSTLASLHEYLRESVTVGNTIAVGCEVVGTLMRGKPA
ncbi:MAG: OsmC family protein [Proteobacteria bacterium]|nr:OsmC family protein [Pseudomonadota bacterium]